MRYQIPVIDHKAIGLAPPFKKRQVRERNIHNPPYEISQLRDFFSGRLSESVPSFLLIFTEYILKS